MNILVCIKQVATSSDGSTLSMNRFDEYALEEAIQIKERLLDQGRGAVVDVITVGRKTATEVIKRAFGIGADNGCHIVVENNPSAAVTAELIYQALEQMPGQTIGQARADAPGGNAYDLVLTGMISQDGMEGQTGPFLAEHMGMACATGVVKISLDSDALDLTVERELDRGGHESLGMTLPALLTVQAGMNTPRYPTLSNLLRAGSKEITTLTVSRDRMPVDGQTVVRLQEPAKTRSGTMLRGTIDEKARALFSILQKRGVL